MFALRSASINRSKIFFPPFNLVRSDFEHLIMRSASQVIGTTIKNMQRLLEEAREAHRLLAQRERRTHTYEVLHLRHHKVHNT
ncbi:MAG: hypothetical protein HYX48_01355 [Chlamydiales bacterium]|nr:hypothetical protein [Chlamydiales bacterium]